MTLKELKKNKKSISYNIAIQMDSPYELDKKTDSTFALIEEALIRNYNVFIYMVGNLSLINNKPKAIGQNVLNINIKKKNSFFADAPIAKTRQAAIDGTLAIMVGSDLNTYKHLLPVFNLIGEDIMHCGDVGSGQLTKIMNNMILFETVVALSEAANIAEKYGMSVEKLFNNITKCSGDSFALKNHGLRSIAKDNFPSPAFSSEYALKDLSYALELGNKLKIKLPGAETAKKLLQTSIEQGDKDLYFPVIKKYLK